jgi:biopolymer transport protein ExbD
VSTQSTSLLGYGLYFIDVLACLLFCIVLALVGARFGTEQTVAVDLPRMEAAAEPGGDVSAPSITLRSEGQELRIYLEDEAMTLAELEARLRSAPPPSVVVRSEDSTLSSVIAVAHAAGVHDIQLAYATASSGRGHR